MATVYKIHPAIGIARVGNSPDEFFIGPERVGERPDPPGGFKDGQCRVKRQAARFHIFAHHDDGTVEEITRAKADITWTVHLVNSKAANPDRGNSESASDLTIDPGQRMLSGPNQRQLFDSGQIKFSGAPVATVPLGEIRTDTNSHLLVLGGFGKSGSPAGTALDSYFWASDDWYDDVSDGPVAATVKILADNSTPPVTGAWVIVAPPKFAPHQDSVITLYDRVFQAMVDGGLLTAPTTTSYTKDVYPILQRARDTGWVDKTYGSHVWTDPVTSDVLRNAIFNKLKAPAGGGGNMPEINDSGTSDDRLTATQYAHMQRWKDNTYTNDWVAAPPPQANITPDGLDRAALEACVGAAFYPGIEAGGLSNSRPIIVAANFSEAFRLNQGALSPGDLTYVMALPWQNDFRQCADNWWPVPRPNYVTRQGTPDQAWIGGAVTDGQSMVDNWHALGFVVRQGAQHVEVDRCDLPSINLLTPVLNFQDVPQGPMGMVREAALAITFEVTAPAAAVTLEYTMGGAPSHPQLVAFNTSVTVGPTPANGVATARLWVIYRTSNAGDVLPPQTVAIQEAGGTQSWNVTILGNTVARKIAAAALVLDRSGSMAEDRGDGQSKHTSLQQAASIFVDVMLEGDGVGLVRFNEDAQVLQSIVQLGNGDLSDINRGNTKDIINGSGLDPNGQTSIGDGIFEGRGILNAATTPFDVKSLVVLTDGVENSPKMIADVAADISEYTYAVGLGQPQNISVPALQTISGNNGGYLLVTGAIGTDNRFLLQKYFLQILAGISNAEIVLDPEGELIPGRVERVPFRLTAADAGVDVILLTPYVKAVDFRLQTPSGQIIEPWRAASEPGMRFVLSNGVSYYRLALPIEFMADRFDAGGMWHALLTIGRPRLERSNTRDGSDSSIRRSMLARPAQATPGAGPIAHERIVPDVLSDLVYDRIAFFTDVATKPHMLFLGRKGAGKSALLSQIRSGTQKKGRRGLVFYNDEPISGRNYVIDVYSWEHFHQIVRNVNRLLKQDDIFDELVPSEYFVELWYQTLWDEIIHHFYNYYFFDDECQRLLDPIEKYVNADGEFEGSAHKHARNVFDRAKAAILNFLNERASRLYFLFDSMENYPVRHPTFLRIISGLFQGLTKINDESPRIIVSFSIPEEIESFITSGSTNLMKDLASSYRIRWRPTDLVRVVAHRLRLSASVHDAPLFEELKELDFAKRDDLHRLFDIVLPKKITNSHGADEDTLAYIIRHTQLLPRHILAIFNAALSDHYKAAGTLRALTEKSIRDGITAVEKLIAKQILMPYEQIYPKLLCQCKSILPDLGPICDRNALRRTENRFHRLIEDDVGSVWHTLFEIGILGRSTHRNGSDTQHASRDERYCYGQFHYNIDGAFSLPTDGEFCFHPVFSRAFGILRRNKDNRVVYPADIGLEDVYANI